MPWKLGLHLYFYLTNKEVMVYAEDLHDKGIKWRVSKMKSVSNEDKDIENDIENDISMDTVLATTKERIIQATIDVIEEKTISGTRMRIIADKANLFQSNLHYYFKTKKELLLATQKKVADRCIELRANYQKTAKSTLEDELQVFFEQKITFIIKEPRYDYAEIDFWVQSRFDEDFKAEFKRSFLQWRSELQDLIEKYAPDMKAQRRRTLASICISLLEGATIQYLIDSEAFDVNAYFDYCKEILIKEIKREYKD